RTAKGARVHAWKKMCCTRCMWCRVVATFSSPVAWGVANTVCHTVASAHAMWRASSRTCRTESGSCSVIVRPCRDLAQIGEPPDDSIRLHWMSGRQAPAPDIDPDPIDALSLRLSDVPLEIVTDHPGIGGGDAERIERTGIHPGIRLAEPDFTLDENRMKQICQPESCDLASLHRGTAIREQREPTPARPQPSDGVDRICEWLEPGVSQLVVGIANPLRQI